MNEKGVIPLRERQMLLGKEEILNVAFQLFCGNGYTKTTVQEIADGAGVGPATVFRHFRSKLGLLTGLIKRDLEPIWERGEDILATSRSGPIDTLTKLLDMYFDLLDAPSKAIESDAYRKRQFDFSKIEINDLLSGADVNVQAQIRKVILMSQEKGQMRKDLHVEHMVAVLFQVFNHHYYEADNRPKGDRAEIQKRLSKRVTIMFESWV